MVEKQTNKQTRRRKKQASTINRQNKHIMMGAWQLKAPELDCRISKQMIKGRNKHKEAQLQTEQTENTRQFHKRIMNMAG